MRLKTLRLWINLKGLVSKMALNRLKNKLSTLGNPIYSKSKPLNILLKMISVVRKRGCKTKKTSNYLHSI